MHGMSTASSSLHARQRGASCRRRRRRRRRRREERVSRKIFSRQ
jgi:hypothetical protein